MCEGVTLPAAVVCYSRSRFWQQPNLVTFLLVGVGLATSARFALRFLPAGSRIHAAVALLAVVAFGCHGLQQRSYAISDQSANW